MTFIHILAAWIVIAIVSTRVFAETIEKKNSASVAQDIDSIIQRLEKQLIEQEGLYSPPEKSTQNKPQKSNPTTTYNMPTKVINSESDEQVQLKEISEAIAKIETEADELGGKIQRTKQQIIEESSLNNRVLIDIAIENEKTASLRSLSFKIDGLLIYEANESAGLWIPSNELAVYAGPLTPGDHDIEVGAKFTTKSEEKPYLHGSLSRDLKQSFKISVPTGDVSKRWKIIMSPSKSAEAQSSAKLVAIEVP